jgi:RNA polymerase sigma-70 factor (ECF subfamily)
LDDQQTGGLVRRCLAGESAAWEEIVRFHNRRVYNLCYRFTSSAESAEDLTQEVFIKIYRTLGTYDIEKGAFTTWLSTLTRNLLVDHFRRTKQDRVTDSIDAGFGDQDDSPSLSDRLRDPGLSPADHVTARETQQLVQHALARLSPDLREAVILRDLQDMDYREIASVLRVPEGTVKSRINRGRTELARLLSRNKKQAGND